MVAVRNIGRILATLVLVAAVAVVSAGTAQATTDRSCAGGSAPRVCIDVTGSGTYVNSVKLEQFDVYSWCGTPEYHAYYSNGNLEGSGYGIRKCGSAGQWITESWSVGYNVSGKVCGHWSNRSSLAPCVHMPL